MTPNVGVASERCARAPDSVDAFAIGDRARLVALVSAPRGVSGGAARGGVRAIQDHVDRTLRAGTDLASLAPAAVVAELAAAVRRSVAEGSAVLVAHCGAEHVVVVATAGMRCYRLRRDEMVHVTATGGGPADGAPGTLHSWVEPIVGGDAFLFCTEGLFSAVNEGRIRTALRDNYRPRDVAWSLVEAARTVELRADVTAIVVRPPEPDTITAAPAERESA